MPTKQIPLEDIQSNGKQYLAFMLDAEEYAMDILQVQEIKSWSTVTPIPTSPAHMLGVMNLRGAIVPVIDLRLRFGLSETETRTGTAIIIVRSSSVDGDNRLVGMAVDQVSDVYFIEKDNVQHRSDVSTSAAGEYVYGLSVVNETMVMLIDVNQVVNSSIDIDEKDQAA